VLRLSALDASFLEFEDAVTHMHIGSIALFEGPPPTHEGLRADVLAKLALVPRYRQLVRFVPFRAGLPVWVDDPHFNLDYHLRRTALPRPGGEQQLRMLVGRVMSQQLDRSKPLWEMWIAEGLEEDRWALVSKVHHCMVDGVAGSDLLTVLLDRERDPAPAASQAWTPKAASDGLALLAQALVGDLLVGYAAARALRTPFDLLRRGQYAARGLLRMRGLVRPAPPSSLNGSVGPHRRWSMARTRLADVKTVRTSFGGTVNDVVLACIAGGFRALLLSRGESVERVVRTMVPVSVRSPGEHGEYNNRVSVMFAELPVAIEDPVGRLRSISAQMGDLKESNEAVAGEVLTALGGFAPPLLLALGERLATRVPQHNINTVTTNVPGAQYPLYAGGRKMLEAFPYVPLGGHVRVGVAIFSYDGALTFGVTGDYDTTADIEVVCEGIERAMAELLHAGGTRRRPAARGRRPAARGRRSAQAHA
jgi:diacylglycerol O-acyltransferase